MSKKQILVIDEDIIGLGLFAQIFEKQFQVFPVSNVEIGRKVLSQNVIDLLVYSNPIEAKNGFEILKEAKEKFPHTKRVLMYFEPDQEIISKAINEDLAHAWVRKPWKNSELVKVVNDVLSENSFHSEFETFRKDLVSFKEILRNQKLVSFFQPITQFNPFKILGYELFTRGPLGTKLHDSLTLLRLAHHGGMLLEFENAARNSAIQTISSGPTIPKKIFLNNCPSIILSPQFEETLIYDRLGIEPKNIVIEINESSTLDNYKDLITRLNYYRSRGFQVAVDDVGKENSGLYLTTEIKPDFAKLDISVIRDLSQDSQKMHFISQMVEFGKKNGVQIVAEGVETQEEYHSLTRLEVNMGQGYLFGKPKNQIETDLSFP